MKKKIEFFEKMTTEYPFDYKKLSHDGHTIYTDYSQCRKHYKMRIDWKRSVNRTVTICYDGKVKKFKITEYIEKPSPKAHDAKIKVQDTKSKNEYTLWSRDFKQGDFAGLFK